MAKKKLTDWLWDAWCVVSGIGIWPRFIEPRLIEITRKTISVKNLSSELEGLKILHFSDLHWNSQFSPYLQKKLIKKANSLSADLVVFTGDFLCRSQLENPEGLKFTLESIKAKIGCFAILGNHDYAQFVTVNKHGEYDVDEPESASNIGKGFKRLFQSVFLKKHITERARQVGYHTDLINLIEQTQFQLLNNKTKLVSCKGSWINVCGLEEYTLGRLNPEETFKNYNVRFPGVVLAHNPDGWQLLKNYPGDLILSGHTHGGQVNLPVLWKRFTRIEHLNYKRGLVSLGKKQAYVNRGISSMMKFRWFASPELTLITLQKG